MHKVTSLVMALIMAITMISATAFAQVQDTTDYPITYSTANPPEVAEELTFINMTVTAREVAPYTLT